MDQFRCWFDDALATEHPDYLEVNAMTLSTVDEDGRPDARIVLLKGHDATTLRFFSNYRSAKGRQIEHRGEVALTFYWPHVERQVRVRGNVHRSSRETTRRYFESRPRESRLGALVSEQSTVVDGREVLEERMRTLGRQYPGDDIPCPDHWGGYEVTPREVEFWQGRVGRLHDRVRYRSDGDAGWVIERLCP